MPWFVKREETEILREVGMLQWIYHKAENPSRLCCTGRSGGYTIYSSNKTCASEGSITQKLH